MKNEREISPRNIMKTQNIVNLLNYFEDQEMPYDEAFDAMIGVFYFLFLRWGEEKVLTEVDIYNCIDEEINKIKKLLHRKFHEHESKQ